MAAIEDALARTMPAAEMIQVSAMTGAGIEEWVSWLERRRADSAATVAAEAG